MKKLTIDLPKGAWGTVKTKYAKNSPVIEATEFVGASKNFDTWRKGSITKRLGGDEFNPVAFTNAVQDTYEAVFADGTRNLLAVDGVDIKYSTGTTTFSVLHTPVTASQNWEFAMYQDRVYGGNATNNPIVYDKSKTTKVKDMGCQVPTIGACAGAAGAATPNTVPDGTYTYKITFLYYGAQESNGSGATASVTVAGGPKPINLTAIPVGATDHVTSRKIYRDDGTSGYLFVGAVNDNVTTTYQDVAVAGTSPIPTDNNPPTNFGLIITYLDRLWTARVVGQPSYVKYSEAGWPDVFLSTNYLLCNPVDPIVAIVEWNDRVIVFNRTSMGQITGRTKDAFYYSSISDSVGCADNRSVRVRTVDGIPTLIWLSNKGVYMYNGSAVVYISDAIEDLVNVNVQQASNTKGKNSQVPSYSLTNPSKVWNDNAEWDDGLTSLSNIASLLDNSLRVPILYSPTNSEGTYLGAAIPNGTINSQIPVGPSFTGEAIGNLGYRILGTVAAAVAHPFILGRNATLTSVGFGATELVSSTAAISCSYTIEIRPDVSGTPSPTPIYSSGALITTTLVSPGVFTVPTHSLSISLTAGARYWMTLWASYGGGAPPPPTLTYSAWVYKVATYHFPNENFSGVYYSIGSGYWFNVGGNSGYGLTPTPFYTCVTTPVPQSGQWVSNVYDSKSDTVGVGISLTQTATIPSGASVISTVETADNYSGPFVSDASSSVANLNGTQALTLTVAKRFWRLKQTLYIDDDRHLLLVGSPTLKFTLQGVWISDVLDCSVDVTAYNAILKTTTLPSGTSIDTFIRTSATGSGGWTAWNSNPLAVVVNRYAQVKAELNSSTGNVLTPILQALQLNWTKVLTITGGIIDEGAAPVGWDTFVASYALNGGTAVFYTRAATTSGGITGATWHAITSGAFIAEPLYQFSQWKAILTATAGSTPTLAGVDVNWYKVLSNTIRASSLFVNRSYYLSVAEYNQTTNNLVLVYDPQGKWRVYRGITIAAFVSAFGEAYASDATSKKLMKWLSNVTDQGAAIEMVVETKAFDFDAPRNDKVMRKFYLRVRNTGARYYTYCSFNMGTSWISMKDMHTGLSYIDTATDQALSITRWVPDFGTANMYGKTVSFKVTNNDVYEAEILGIESESWVRMGDII